MVSPTANLRLELKRRCPDWAIVGAQKIEGVNDVVEIAQIVGCIILHLQGTEEWVVLDFLRSAYPDIPIFAVVGFVEELPPDDEDIPFVAEKIAGMSLAQQYGVTAILREPLNFAALSSLVESHLAIQPKENAVALFAEQITLIHEELVRLQKELRLEARKVCRKDIARDDVDRLEAFRVKAAALKMQN